MENINKVLSYLEDEESKFIYLKKLEYNKTNDICHIRDILEKYLPEFKGKIFDSGIEEELILFLKSKKKIVLFGSGLNGKKFLNLLSMREIAVSCIADNDSYKWGTKINGVEIKAPDDIDFSDVDAVVITPYKQELIDAIKQQLIRLGVQRESMVIYRDAFPYYLEWKQYFEPNIIEFKEDEVFIDAGALDLGTSTRFAKLCKDNNVNFKIYAFEPDRISYKKCNDVLSNTSFPNLKLYNLGLWHENTTLYFSEQGDGSSRIMQQEMPVSAKVVSLDSCITDKVTFIKMDIEGAELNALKGSREIIKKYKPRLAVSVYHKKEDLIEIPLYIKELVPEYKLYIRHYSNAAIETVLYAVV